MEGIENQGSTAVAEPTEAAQPAAQPNAEESGGSQQESRPSFNDVIRERAGYRTSKSAEDAPTGEPAPSGDVEAGRPRERGADGKFLSRRGAPEAIKSQQDEIDDLKRQLEDRDPAKLRAQWDSEQAQRAAGPTDAEMAQLFDRACRMADTDPRLSELVEGDSKGRTLYQWREDRKDLVANYPEAETAIRADAERRYRGEYDGLVGAMRSEMAAAAAEYGVDPDSWKQQGTTWGSMTRDAVEAVAGPLRDRVRELETELGQHARFNGERGLGATRAPADAGRSMGGQALVNTNERIRNRLHDVLNGRRAAS